jgi:hypothetical protein
MDCAAVKPKMEALVSGSLPPAERAMAEQHIAICEGCRLELELVRAIGSQEKQPAGSGSKDDWTLDRIFGAEGAPGASAAAAEPSPAKDPAPATPSSRNESEAESDSASIFGSSEPEPAFAPESDPAPQHPALIPESDEDPESQRPPGRKKVEASWSFEPADAKSDVKPPEESLFFAAEALTRKGSAAKGSNSRVILWSLGGVVGVGLLVFSAWFVLHMNSSGGEGPASRIQSAPSPVPSAPSTETSPSPAPSPTDGEIQDEGGQAPNSAVEATPPPTPQPRVTASAAPTQPRVSASTAPPQPMPLATRTSAPQSRATTPVTRPTGSAPLATAGTEHHAAPAPAGPSTPSATPEHRVTSTFMPPPDDMTSDDSSADGGEAETPAVASPTVPKPTGPSTSTARGSSMWESRAPKGEPPAEPETPAQPEVSTPIDRLHLATVTATENGDLDRLRRLRATWKSLMVKIIGPDRARAKREYADCLWAIQDATGRRADQKDALAAYRDYLLGAPAGGADSRSVSRLRQLEDAIAESR